MAPAPMGTEVAHVTRDSDTTFKVKRSEVKVIGAGHIVAAPAQLVCLENVIKSDRQVMNNKALRRLMYNQFC